MSWAQILSLWNLVLFYFSNHVYILQTKIESNQIIFQLKFSKNELKTTAQQN